MRWIARGIPFTLALAVWTSPLAGQVYLFAGGGASLPVSEYGDFAKTGWLASGGLSVDLGDRGWWAAAEGMYGSNDHEGTSSGKTDIYGANALLGYTIATSGAVRPYLYGAAGVLAHKFKPATTTVSGDTESKFNWAGAGGLSFVLSEALTLWTEGRYNGASGTEHIALQAGLNIRLSRRQ